MHRELKAFIFDMDGVLTDTVEYHYRSWQRLAKELDIPFSAADNQALLGRSRSDCLKIFLKGRKVSEEEFQELYRKKNAYFLESLADFSTQNLLPGVRSLLESMKQNGYALAVGSSSRNTTFILERLKIAALFDAVCDSNTVYNAKPAPDLFLEAARLISMNPHECAVIEDSEAGILSGLAAQMLVIGVGPEERIQKAHLHYRTMAEITLEDILKRISGGRSV